MNFLNRIRKQASIVSVLVMIINFVLLPVFEMGGHFPFAINAISETVENPGDNPEPTDTPALTDTSASTNTPTPTDAPVPINTPTPTDANTPSNIPVSTDTSVPAETLTPTDTPAPTDTPVLTDTTAPTNTPVPSETSSAPTATPIPTDVVTLIDYEHDATYSTTFSEGYIEVLREASLFETASSSDCIAKIGRGIAYVVSRVNAGEARDRLLIAFDSARGVMSGYIAASDVRPISREETNSYIASHGDCENHYQGSHNLPLAVLDFEYTPAPEPEQPTPTPLVFIPDQTSQPQGDAYLKDGAWLYNLDAEGYAIIGGYDDPSIKALTIPVSLGGTFVTGIDHEAFVNNPELRVLTVHGNVMNIAPDAFAGPNSLTVRALNGSAALSAAKSAGLKTDNISELYFLESVKDLSDVNASRYAFLSSTDIQFMALEARRINVGDIFYLPASDRYPIGAAFQVTGLDPSEKSVVVRTKIPDGTEVLTRVVIHEEDLQPDLSNIVFLTDGVSLDSSAQVATERSFSGNGSLSIPVLLNLKVGNCTISGGATIKYSLDFDADIRVFPFKVVEYTVKSTETKSINVKIKGSPGDGEKVLKTKLFTLPCISSGLMFVNLVVSLEVNWEGEIEYKADIQTVTGDIYKNGQHHPIKSRTVSGQELSGSFMGCVALVGAVEVTVPVLGRVFELEIKGGPEFGLETTLNSTVCMDLSIKLVMSAGVKIGLLESSKLKLYIGGTFVEAKFPIAELHLENGKIVPSCTQDLKTVRFYTGTSHEIPPQFVKLDKMVKQPLNPARAGYVFMGWYTDTAGTDKWDFANDLVQRDIILYAKWDKAGPASPTIPPPGGSTPTPGKTTPTPLPPEESLAYLSYSTYNGNVTIMGYKGAPERITIPALIGDTPVTSIRNNAFSNCGSLVSIDIPEGVTSIGNEAFYNCGNLVSINIPNSVTDIGYTVFRGCTKLVRVDLPDHATSIGDYAFYGCSNLSSIHIPEGVTSIGFYAFTGCSSLTSIHFPDSITSIGDDAFKGCNLLKSITLPPNLYTIRGGAFSSPYITSVTIPKSVTNMTTSFSDSNSAFGHCDNLQRVVFEDGTKVIPSVALFGCKNLREVIIPDSVTSIGVSAFEGCTGLLSISLPVGLRTIDRKAFKDCDNLRGISLPPTLNNIMNEAFSSPYITSVTVPSSISTMRSVYFGGSAFSACPKLAMVEFESGVTYIPDYALSGCASVTEIVLPNNLKGIGVSAFAGCTGLVSVDIPDSVTSIASYAFHACFTLRNISLPSGLGQMGGDIFNSPYITSVTIPRTVTWMSDLYSGASPFRGCQNLKLVKFELGMTKIPNCALNGCNSVEEVVIPDSVTVIGNEAFRGCNALRAFNWPQGLREIGGSSFSSPYINSVTIPRTVTVMSSYIGSAFRLCPNLTKVDFEAGLTKIPEAALNGCSNVHEVTIPDSVTSIGNDAFAGCAIDMAYCEKGSYADSYFSAMEGCVLVYPQDDLLTVTYLTGPGDNQHAVNYAAPGQLLSAPAVPMRSGYCFLGWYKDSACTQAWDFLTDVMPDTGLTLVAGWERDVPGFIYHLDDNGNAVVEAYTGTLANLAMPQRLGGHTITAIEAGAFDDGVQYVTVPAGLTDIQDGAFSRAGSLKSIAVEAGNSAFTVQGGVLYTAALDRLLAYPAATAEAVFTVPEGVTQIASYAFAGASSLNTLILPESLDEIGANAFQNCLESIALFGPIGKTPGAQYARDHLMSYNLYTTTYLLDGEFVYSVGNTAGELLTEPYIPQSGDRIFLGWSEQEDDALWDFDNDLMPASELILYGVWGYDFAWEVVEGGVRLIAYLGSDSRIRVPEIVNGSSVVSIAADAFQGHRDVTLLGNAGSVVESFALAQGIAFEPLAYTLSFHTSGGTAVASRIVLGGTLTGEPPVVIRDNHTLLGWYQDEDFTKPWDYTSDLMPYEDISLYALWEIVDTSLPDLPFTYEEVDGEAQITGYTGSDASATLPGTINGLPVTSIAPYAFFGDSSLETLTLPEGLKAIGTNAFAESKIIHVDQPSTLTSLGERAFSGCGYLTRITLSAGLTSLPEGLLEDCTALTSIIIPEGVKELAQSCLAGCQYLETINLPQSLKTVGKQAFFNCRYLTGVTLDAAVEDVDADAFDGCIRLTSIQVDPANPFYSSVNGVLMDKYGEQLLRCPEGLDAAPFQVSEGVWRIGPGAFEGCHMTQLVLPTSVTTIEKEAFADCRGLLSVSFVQGISLNELPPRAFAGCTQLAAITLPISLMGVGSQAFAYCQSLTEIRFPSGILAIGSNALPNDTGIIVYGSQGTQAQSYAQVNGLRFLDPSSMIAVTGITLPENNLSLVLNETRQLTVQLYPTDTTETAVTFTSSNASVASVTKGGMITARGVGSTVITATAENGACDTITVTVAKETVEVSAVYFLQSEKKMLPQTAGQLTAYLTPANATNRSITWESSNTSVVSVTTSGLLVARSVGTATVKASASGGAYAQILVQVSVAVESIILSDTDLTMNIGESSVVSASVLPLSATIKDLNWSTSDSSVATVNDNGIVTGIQSGTATVTATAIDGSGVNASCAVTVNQPVTSITLSKSSSTIAVNATLGLTATVLPSNATNKNVTWSSSDTTVASVSNAGLVTCKKAGTAVVRATAQDGSSVYGQCTITVKQYVTQLTLNSTSFMVVPGKTYALTATALPADASDKRVSWSSSNTALASVSASGVVTGVRPGSVSITAAALDGSNVKATCTVNVAPLISTIKLTPASITIGVGQAVSTVIPTVLPAEAGIKTLFWSSSNPTIANVDTTGKIAGVKTGTATITATSTDGSGKTASVVVTVVSAGRGVTAIKLSTSSASVYVKKTLTLKATLSPTTVSNPTVQWVSSNTSVATVLRGVVTGVAPGTATITAISSSGYMAKCTITVTDVPVSSVAMSKTTLTVLASATYQLTATVLPADAKVKTLTWTSSNTSVAIVSTTGKVTAKALGTATITAKSNNGKTATCLVKVNPVKITKLTLSPTSTTILIAKGEALGKQTTIKANITPSNATIRSLNWTTSNSKVATVDQNGVVKSIGYGTAIITAAAKDGSSEKAICTITVAAVKVASLKISGITTMAVGSTQKLTLTVLPSNAVNSSVTWSSSNINIATVDSQGNILAKTKGTVTITAVAKDGSGKKATLGITVR